MRRTAVLTLALALTACTGQSEVPPPLPVPVVVVPVIVPPVMPVPPTTRDQIAAAATEARAQASAYVTSPDSNPSDIQRTTILMRAMNGGVAQMHRTGRVDGAAKTVQQLRVFLASLGAK